jgi:SWIM zinc finger
VDALLNYDQPTMIKTDPRAVTIELATNRRRSPARLHGRVTDPLIWRQMLLTLHACIQREGRNRWDSPDSTTDTFDPVVTIHPDRLFIEAFSPEGSCYAQLSAPTASFAGGETPVTGSTNIDFGWDLRESLQNMPTSHETWLSIGADASGLDHFERERTMAEPWLKGLLQMQVALAMRPYYITCRPNDLLSIIAYLDEHWARKSPQGVRYEMRSGEPVQVVLEPWEERFALRGTSYTGYERTVRVWGRRRLAVLRDILPFAQRVTIGVLGRGLPHLYIVQSGPYRLVLALAGWAASDWAMGNSFDLLAPLGTADSAITERITDYLDNHLTGTREGLAATLGLAPADVERSLFTLSRSGKALYDTSANAFRRRDLFGEPLDLDTLFAPDPRLANAQHYIDTGHVEVQATVATRAAEVRLEGVVHDTVDYQVQISIDDNGRLRFGRCTCPFFQASLMSKGPCAHILAVRLAYDTKEENKA